MKDALWFLGSALAALIIVTAVMTAVIRIERPAPAVQQTGCTVTTAWPVRG